MHFKTFVLAVTMAASLSKAAPASRNDLAASESQLVAPQISAAIHELEDGSRVPTAPQFGHQIPPAIKTQNVARDEQNTPDLSQVSVSKELYDKVDQLVVSEGNSFYIVKPDNPCITIDLPLPDNQVIGWDEAHECFTISDHIEPGVKPLGLHAKIIHSDPSQLQDIEKREPFTAVMNAKSKHTLSATARPEVSSTVPEKKVKHKSVNYSGKHMAKSKQTTHAKVPFWEKESTVTYTMMPVSEIMKTRTLEPKGVTYTMMPVSELTKTHTQKPKGVTYTMMPVSEIEKTRTQEPKGVTYTMMPVSEIKSTPTTLLTVASTEAPEASAL